MSRPDKSSRRPISGGGSSGLLPRVHRYVNPPGAKLWSLGGPDVCAGRRRLVPGCARVDFRPHVRSVPGQRVDAQTPGEHSVPARTRPLSRSRGLQASLRPQVCLTAAGWQASRPTGACAGRSLALRSCAPTLLHVFRLERWCLVGSGSRSAEPPRVACVGWYSGPSPTVRCESARLEARPIVV